MDENVIITEIKKYIENNILDETAQVQADSDLKLMGIDSFSTVEIILFIERRFGVSIPDEKLVPDNFRSIQALASIVAELTPDTY